MKQEILKEETNTDSIETLDTILGRLQQLNLRRSIASSVSDIQPLKTSTGKVNSIYRDKDTDTTEVKSKLVEASTYEVKTAFTREALEDMYAIYGESLEQVLENYFSYEVSAEIDEAFIAFCKANATSTLTQSFNPADFKDFKAVTENIIVKMNKERMDLRTSVKRNFRQWAIVSKNIATALTTNAQFSQPSSTPMSDGSQDDAYIGTFGGCDVYLDANHNLANDYVLIGTKGNGMDASSTIFSPYTNMIQTYVSSNDGEQRIRLMNRTGFCINPLDIGTGANDSDYLVQYEVDLSGFTI